MLTDSHPEITLVTIVVGSRESDFLRMGPMVAMVLGLLLCTRSLSAQGPNQPTPAERYTALLTEWESRAKDCQESYEKAKTDKERAEAVQKNPRRDVDAYIDRFLQVAEAEPTDAGARDSLLWIVETGLWADDNAQAPKGRTRRVGRAMDLLFEHHRNDRKLGLACLTLVNFPSLNRDKFLRAVFETTSDREVKGRTCWSLAEYLRIKAGLVQNLRAPIFKDDVRFLEWRYGDYVKHLRSCDPDAMLAESEQLCERTIRDYGALAYVLGTAGPATKKTLADVAERSLNEIRHLAVGNIAPEIVGEDADGVVFRLTDYRGKVVVLTFSGSWCGPCRAMYPQERGLVERMKAKSFALLSVNTDEDKRTLRKSIQAGEVTWRCWQDGRAGGPICSKWSVYSFPTVYVLDSRGVIRFKGVDGKALDEAVDTLMKRK
jgi:thiol-disulfide isomerase/thioredoxin